MRKKWQESIAPHLIRITTQEKKFGSVTLLRTYEPFKVEAPNVLREGIGESIKSHLCCLHYYFSRRINHCHHTPVSSEQYIEFQRMICLSNDGISPIFYFF